MVNQPETSLASGPKRQIWRFIPEMLLILLVLVWLSARLLPNSANRQRRAAAAIEQHGGDVRYDYQKMVGQAATALSESPSQRVNTLLGYSFQVKPPGPAPLRWLLGKHYFISAVYVRVGRTSDNCLARLADLPDIEHASLDGGMDGDLENFKQLCKLRYLSLNGYTVLDADRSPFWVLEHLPNLETLDLANAQFGDGDVKYLRHTPKLKRLVLNNTAIGDKGLAYLQNMNRLEFLALGSTNVTDRGITYLSGLPKLQSLGLDYTEVSDSSSDSFVKMTSLRELSLLEAQVEGIGRLRRALPNCAITYSKRKSRLDAEHERL